MDKGILKCVNIIWEREDKYMCCFYIKYFWGLKDLGLNYFMEKY